MPSRSVTIRVPATTSNLGPGFDTLGIALKIYAWVSVTRAQQPEIKLLSSVSPSERAAAQAIIDKAAGLFFHTTGVKPFGAKVTIDGRIPVARGLGSSVGVRLGLMAGLNELSGRPLDRAQLLNLVTQLEGHPDNAAPAVFGGFAIAARLGDEVRCLHYKMPAAVRFVALIPKFEISTEKARALLPPHYSRQDAVHNLSRAALLAAALATRKFSALPQLFDDRWHEPYRQPLIPPLRKVISAGEKAGALGGWLSGSGSTIICLTLKAPQEVARAMQAELPESEVRIVPPDNDGFRVTGARTSSANATSISSWRTA